LAILFEGVSDRPQSLKANIGLLLLLSNDRFLPNPFQFIFHELSCHSTLYTPS